MRLRATRLGAIALAARRGGGAEFSPITVSGTHVFDVTNWGSMFQDAAQTVPVTAYGQPVRVIRDLTVRAAHLVAPSDAARPILTEDSSGRPYLNFPTSGISMISASTLTVPTPAMISALMSFGAGSSAANALVASFFESTTALFSLAHRASLLAARARVRNDSDGVAAVTIVGAANDITENDVQVHHVTAPSLSMSRGIGVDELHTMATAWDSQSFESCAIEILGFTGAPFRFYGGVWCYGAQALEAKAEIIDWLEKKR
jgi:hypothetical protein